MPVLQEESTQLTGAVRNAGLRLSHFMAELRSIVQADAQLGSIDQTSVFDSRVGQTPSAAVGAIRALMNVVKIVSSQGVNKTSQADLLGLMSEVVEGCGLLFSSSIELLNLIRLRPDASSRPRRQELQTIIGNVYNHLSNVLPTLPKLLPGQRALDFAVSLATASLSQLYTELAADVGTERDAVEAMNEVAAELSEAFRSLGMACRNGEWSQFLGLFLHL
jgi:hypothetical protein